MLAEHIRRRHSFSSDTKTTCTILISGQRVGSRDYSTNYQGTTGYDRHCNVDQEGPCLCFALRDRLQSQRLARNTVRPLLYMALAIFNGLADGPSEAHHIATPFARMFGANAMRMQTPSTISTCHHREVSSRRVHGTPTASPDSIGLMRSGRVDMGYRNALSLGLLRSCSNEAVRGAAAVTTASKGIGIV